MGKTLLRALRGAAVILGHLLIALVLVRSIWVVLHSKTAVSTVISIASDMKFSIMAAISAAHLGRAARPFAQLLT